MSDTVQSKTYLVTQEELNSLVALAANVSADRAISVYEKEKKEKQYYNKVEKTKELLKAYRRTKASLNDEVTFSREEELELRWKFLEDLMGCQNQTLPSETSIQESEKRRQEKLYAVQRVESAVELYRQECFKTNLEEPIRRYEELYMMHIDPSRNYSANEIAEKFNVSNRTVYKDLGIAYKIVAEYLIGF